VLFATDISNIVVRARFKSGFKARLVLWNPDDVKGKRRIYNTNITIYITTCGVSSGFVCRKSWDFKKWKAKNVINFKGHRLLQTAVTKKRRYTPRLVLPRLWVSKHSMKKFAQKCWSATDLFESLIKWNSTRLQWRKSCVGETRSGERFSCFFRPNMFRIWVND